MTHPEEDRGHVASLANRHVLVDGYGWALSATRRLILQNDVQGVDNTRQVTKDGQ